MARIPGLPPGSTKLVTCAAFIYGLGLFFLLFTIVDIIAYVFGYDNPHLPVGIGICATLSVILLGTGAVMAPSMWRNFKALREQYKKEKISRQVPFGGVTPSTDPRLITTETADVRRPLVEQNARTLNGATMVQDGHSGSSLC